MKKIITIISVIALISVLCVMLVACGVPANYGDCREKLEAAGYSVSDTSFTSTSGSYLALKAYKGSDSITVGYFPKDNKEEGEKFYSQQKSNSSRTVKKKESSKFLIVYYGTDAAIKDFEK